MNPQQVMILKPRRQEQVIIKAVIDRIEGNYTVVFLSDEEFKIKSQLINWLLTS